MNEKYSRYGRLPLKPEEGTEEYYAQAIANSMLELIIPVVEQRALQIVQTIHENVKAA